jgi:aryl-alcohol dehydrogenase-like predicted oxidoreductase
MKPSTISSAKSTFTAGPIDETVRMIEQLRASGYRVVGLTNWSAEKFRLTRARCD